MADRGRHREYLVSGKSLSSLRVVDLKAELDKRSLPKSGSKKDLVERLRLHLELEESREAAQKDQEAEEHVPNLALANEAIAENDFIREYLAAQQACYQSQREAKKQYEEQQRESEASAEETTQDEDESATDISFASPSKASGPGSAKKSEKLREKQALLSPEQAFASTSLLSTLSKYDSPMQASNVTDFASPASTTVFQSPEMHPYSTPPPEHALPLTRQRDLPAPVQNEPLPLVSQTVVEPLKVEEPENLSLSGTTSSVTPSTTVDKEKTFTLDTPKTEVLSVLPEDLSVGGPSTSTPILPSKKRKFLQFTQTAADLEDEASAAQALADMASKKLTSEVSPVSPPKELPKEEPTKTEKCVENEEEDKIKEKESILATPEPKPNVFKEALVHLDDPEPMEVDTTLIVQEPGVLLAMSVGKESIGVEKPVEDELSSNKGVRGSPVPPVEEIEAELQTQAEQQEEKIVKDVAEPEPASREEVSSEVMGGRNSSAHRSPRKSLIQARVVEEEKPVPEKPNLPTDPTEIKPEVEKDAELAPETNGPSQENKIVEKEASDSEKNVPPVTENSEVLGLTTELLLAPTAKIENTKVEKEVSQTSKTVETEAVDEEEAGDELQIEKEESEDEETSRKRSGVPISDSESGSDDDTQHQRYRRSSRTRKSRTPEPKQQQQPTSPEKGRPELPTPTAKRLKRDNLPADIKTEVPEICPEVQPLESVVPLRKLKMRSSKSVEGNGVNGNEESQVGHKRRWASSVTHQTNEPTLIISTESLKELVPDAKLLAPEDVRLTSPEPSRPERPKRPRLEPSASEPVIVPMEKERTALALKADPEPLAPANNPTSSVILVTNLVRPFTINQLRELLCRTGNLVPNAFWIDRVKSTCMAQYESAEEAVATRTALHGVHWPVSNPKALIVDFATEQDLEDCREGRKESMNPGVQASSHTAQTAVPANDRTVKETEEQNSNRAAEDNEQRGFEVKGPIREWDRAKIGEVVPGEREFKRQQDKRDRDWEERTVRVRGEDKTAGLGGERPKDETPAKLLDDLFRKTKTTPSIYWLPLTAEQIAEKEEMRRQRIAERERRMADSQQARENNARNRSRNDHRERDRKPRRDSPPRRR
nr:EOG090X0F73 [Lepidurus arcticus]